MIITTIVYNIMQVPIVKAVWDATYFIFIIILVISSMIDWVQALYNFRL